MNANKGKTGKTSEELEKYAPLVIDELHRLFTTTASLKLKLLNSVEGNLADLTRTELLEVVTKIAHKENILDIDDNENPSQTSPEMANRPINLTIRPHFANWYIGYTLRDKFTFEQLTPINRAKVINLIMDIHERFEIIRSPQITINTHSNYYDQFPTLSSKVINNSKVMIQYREDALRYLISKGIITSFAMDNGNEVIQLTIHIPTYLEFHIKLFTEGFLTQRQNDQTEPSQTNAQNNQLNINTQNDNNPILYKVEFTSNCEIYINNFLFNKPHQGNENAKVFSYLIRNPNRLISKTELEKNLGSVGKDLRKIVENLGFTGNYLKVFFQISKNTSITFRNPIRMLDLQQAKTPHLTFKIQQKNKS